MSILQTHNLIKHFDGVHALDGLTIDIERGKITSIIGPNGSGKTTLVNTLSGMVETNGGSIVINGAKLNKIKPHEVAFYGVTRTFQDVRLFNQMTVMDNLLVVLTERNVFGSLFEKHNQYHLKEVEEILNKLGIWEKRNELAVNLSYGQRKLLEIGRTLATKSEIYLFDEPFAGLFPEMVKTIISIMKELKQNGKTIILIEHNMDLIRELSDHVIVLDVGQLLAQGRPEEVLSSRSVIEAYLGD